MEINRLKVLNYSVRRMHVDQFCKKNIESLEEGSLILDMGGKKDKKRGFFDIEKFNFNVEYANIDEKTKPDYVCNIENVPVEDNKYDVIVLCEVVEHLENPKKVLQEAYRLLKPGGKLIICTPFMFHIHADPHDYGRYTETWYSSNLQKIGFEMLSVEKQGLFFAVFVGNLRILTLELIRNKIKRKIFKRILSKVVFVISKFLLKMDEKDFVKNNIVLKNYTTGFGVVCKKR